MDDIEFFFFKKNERLIQTIGVYKKDIGMEFGIEKCVMLIMRSGKRQIAETQWYNNNIHDI